MKRRRDTRRRGGTGLWIAGGLIAAAVAGAYLWSTSNAAPDAPVAWARLGTADVHALTFDPAGPDRLLFGHHDGLLATTDGGRNWEPTPLTGNDAMNVARLAGERLQIAGHDVYLESTDGGVTWTSVPSDLPGLDLHSFAVDPANPDRAWTFAVGHGLFRTDNAGRNWELLDPGNWGALTAYRRDGVTVLAGIGPEGFVRSSDGGTTWEPMAYPGAPIAAMTAAPDGSAMYAATSAGIRKSTDEGATWSETGFGIQALAIAVSPDDPDLIAAVDSDTLVYRSLDGGTTWPAPGS
jgi:photosystem II stability/assembly factor-like uncharacterized protein